MLSCLCCTRSMNNFLDVWKASLSRLSTFNSFFKDTISCNSDSNSPILNEELNMLWQRLHVVEELLRYLSELQTAPNKNSCVFCINIVDIPSKKSLVPTLALPTRPDSPDSPSTHSNRETLNKECQTEEEIIICRRSDEDKCKMNIMISPSFTEEFLRRLGFDENVMSEEELERKFTQIIQAFAIDKTTFKTRLAHAEVQKKDLEQTLLSESGEMCSIISELHKNNRFFEQELKNLKSLVENCLKTASNLSISYELLGALKHEGKVLNTINIVINHVGNVQNNLQKFTQICRPIKKLSVPSVCCKLAKCFTYTVIISVFLLTFFVFTNTIMEIEYSRQGYNSRISAWSEILVPWVQKRYPHGPPPM